MKVSQYKLADKAVTIDQSQNPIVVGNNLTYTLGVTNNGPLPATCKYTAGGVVCKLTPRNGEVGTVTIATKTPME